MGAAMPPPPRAATGSDPAGASQRSVFVDSEGDAYYARNQSSVHSLEHDPLLRAYRELELDAKSVLEVGSSDGWRLAAMRDEGIGEAHHGVDPSGRAVEAGRAKHPAIDLRVGTADRLPFDDRSLDLVAYGFCLYLCDRGDLFRIASEADRVLRDGGSIAVYDFHTDEPYRNDYSHRPGLVSFKMDHARLFDWSPAYRVVHHDVFPHPTADGSAPATWTDDDLVAVTVLRKDLDSGWPSAEER